jgi:hypothetical protein
MYHFKKHFTLDEARALMPQLRQLFKELHDRRDRARKADEKLGGSLEKSGGDLGGPLVATMLTDYVEMNLEIQRLQSMGIQIKDFDRGLVDFPHLREGREVFLCWELDEDDIEFWHDIEAGYGGRERL